jgi:tetratricopeptide (TPR) repeat protein
MRSPWGLAGLFAAAVGSFSTHALAQTSPNRLFDEGRWTEAAIALFDTVAARSPSPERDLAQFRLAISLYRMGMHQAAYGIFSEIADKPTHTKFAETLLWLAKLYADMPEPADVIERVGKYDDAQIAVFNNAQQRDLYAELSYLLGKYDYRNRRFDLATAEFARVDQSSPLYGKAQMMNGIANVQLRKSVPATQSFQRVILWLDGDAPKRPLPDEGGLRDLANMSLARTYYTASLREDESNQLTVDASRLSASVKYYRRVDPTGRYFTDSLFEEAWARTMAGDYGHALGNLRMLSSPGTTPRYAEGALLEAIILYSACRWDEATTAVARMKQAYEPQKAELARVIAALDKMDPTAQARFVRSGVQGVVAAALGDRMMTSHLEYDAYLDAEEKRFMQTPASFRSSKIGDEVRDAIALARELVLRNIGQLAHERLQRALDELNQHLRDAQKVLIDITAAQRNEVATPPTASDVQPTPKNGSITVTWPVNGQTTPLDPGYRVAITSKCPR